VTAQSRNSRIDPAAETRLADEQAALRRVATMVAAGAEPAEIFASATEEIGRLFGADSAGMVRYDAESHTAEMVGRWESGNRHVFDVGTVVSLSDDTTIARVYREQRPLRLHWADVPGSLAEGMRAAGFTMTVAAPIEVAGRLWGAVSVGWAHRELELPVDIETKLAAFSELVALGLASADARERLVESRVRIVEAGDAARLRLARDLHDGAQQRLVALRLHLHAVQRALPADPERADELLRMACGELEEANAELRDLARGIHPVMLTEQGLAAALRAVARRSQLPVEVVEVPVGRFAPSVEVAVYYVVSEALTNVAKYADATHVSVRAAVEDGWYVVEVQDDGRGGADASLGTGLLGLADRVEALGGSLEVASPRGSGTRVRARLPVTSDVG
jgi:signal transduction histidine kinase